MFVIRLCRATCQEEAKDLHSPLAVTVEVEGDRLLPRSLLPPHHPPRRPWVFHRLLPPYLPHLLHRHSPRRLIPLRLIRRHSYMQIRRKRPSRFPTPSKSNRFPSPGTVRKEDKQIRKSFDYRAARRYQQIMRDLREGELQRLKWLNEPLRERLLHRFATDPGFLKRSAVCKVNRASPKGGCLHTGGSATIPKTHARMTRSLDRPPTEAEVFRETHTRKRDRSIVEKCADDLLTEFSANLEQATQQAQEEGDETAGTVDPDVVWRQTLSEPCRNRVYGAGGFFASSLHRSGYGGSSASATCSQASPANAEVVDLRKQADEVRSLKETLAARDARAEEQLRRLEEMQCQMAAYYDPLRLASNITARGGSGGSSTAPPLPPCLPPPPPAQPDQGPADDDDDYEDA
ncbi:hypothetical protein PIB30_012789 [Stylosanthes scabra]|uniref:Uncharacterized protein n=1 Tax=Stylosanthes scabra TaxID=79078 RepID=A0ABU6T626_9FABA|nr:hypothetical protein [Stylosanthes scabra]